MDTWGYMWNVCHLVWGEECALMVLRYGLSMYKGDWGME